MVAREDKVILRKVDIVDWESAAARQAGKEFNLEGIPYTRVYDGQGKFVSEVSGADIAAIETAVRKAQGK